MRFSTPILFSSFLSILALGPHNTRGQTEVVGSLPGEIVVDNRGSSSYTIPIAVAPGTAGLVPDLSLIYTSQGPNGPLGSGWSVGGLSSIRRGPKSHFNDGYVEGVQFSDQEDRYYLDGHRLIDVNDTSTEFRTELDQFSRVKKTDTNTWTVQTKDGMKLTYGKVGTDENALVKVNGSSNVSSWLLRTMEDTSGNYIRYYYENTSSSNGKNRIQRIVYTGNASQSLKPYASVDFVYESATRSDEIEGYLLGGAFASSNRLDKIVIYTDGDYEDPSNPTAGDYVRHYDLNYTTSSYSGRSLLDSIQVFAGGSVGQPTETLPKTTFEYQNGTTSPVFSKHGITDMERSGVGGTINSRTYDYTGAQGQSVSESPREEEFDLAFGDFGPAGSTTSAEMNGDGFPEILAVSTAGTGYIDIYSTRAHESGGQVIGYELDLRQYKQYQFVIGGLNDSPIGIADFDGDGLTDLVLVESEATVFENQEYTQEFTFHVHAGSGGTFSASHTDQFAINSGKSSSTSVEVKQILTPDLNADGRSDVLVVFEYDSSGKKLKLMSFLAPFDGSAASVKTFDDPKYNHLADHGTVTTFDTNGDRLPDILASYRDNSSDLEHFEIYKGIPITLNTPSGFPSSPDLDLNTQIDTKNNENENHRVVITGDVNGDGNDDILFRFQTSDKFGATNDYKIHYRTYLSTGGTTTALVNAAEFDYPDYGLNTSYPNNDILADINSDGSADLLIISKKINDDEIRVERWLSDNGAFTDQGDYLSSLVFEEMKRYKHSVFFPDFQGNGKPHLVLTTWKKVIGAGNSFDEYLDFEYIGINGSLPDMLTHVRQGYRDAGNPGILTEVKYRPLTDDTVYIKGSGASYPIADFQGPAYVVAEIIKDIGVDSDYSTLYAYADARMHLQGRGFLGFRIVESYDVQKSVAQKQILAQDFPFTGMQISVENYYDDRDGGSPGDQLTSQVRNVLVVDTVNETGGSAVNNGQTLFPFVLQSEEKVFNPGSGNYHAKTRTVSIFDGYTEQTIPDGEDPQYFDFSDIDQGANWFDEILQNGSSMGSDPNIDLDNLPGYISFGNLRQVITTYGDATDNDFKRTVAINGFSNLVNPATWFLGRLQYSSVYGYMPNQPVTTKSADDTFRYAEFSYDITTGLLLAESIYSGSGEGDWLTTTYSRNAYGNIFKTVVSGIDITTRTTAEITQWDSRQRFAVVTENALGHEETKTYDSKLGVVTLLEGPNGIKTEWQYNQFGDVLQETTHDGTAIETTTTTTISFVIQTDPPMTVPPNSEAFTDALGGTHAAQASYSKVVTFTSQSPASTVYYDKLGREIRSKIEDLDPSTEDRYIVKDIIHDSLGRVVAVSENFFSDAAPSYSTSGNSKGWNQTHYDVFGRPWSTTASDNTATKLEYHTSDDLQGGVYRSKVVTTANFTNKGSETASHSQKSTTYTSAFGEAIVVVDDQNNEIRSYYDGHGNLIRTDRVPDTGNTLTTEIVYDSLGWKTQMWDADMAHVTNDKWTYSYNVAGELISQTDPKGQTVIMAYDALGRVTAKNYSTDLKYYRYYYDVTGDPGSEQGREGTLRLVVETDVNGNELANGYRESYHFDEYKRPNLTLTRTDGQYYYHYLRYDSLSRVTDKDYFWRPASVTDQSSYAWLSFGLSYSYNSLSFNNQVYDRTGVVPVVWWSANPADIDARGRLLKYTNGNGTVVESVFEDPSDDDYGRYLDQITVKKGSTLINRTFDFDHLGNVTQRKDVLKNLTEDLVYDRLNRLTNWNITNGVANPTHSATYNDLGNILTKSGLTGTLGYGSSAGPHALTSYTKDGSAYTVQYDDNGNMTQRIQGTAVWVASWTQFNKVKELFLNGASFGVSTEAVRFTYGPDNQRLTEETREGGVFTKKQRYVGPFEQVMHSADGTDTQWDLKHTKIYVDGYGVYTYDHRPLASASTPISRHWFHTDHIGSIIGISDATGTIVEEYAYDAWGQRLDPTDWEGDPASVDTGLTDRGFTGHEIMDAVGLVNMNGRIYDPVLGRFLSADPYVQFPDNFQNYNRYSYVNNNPVSYNDPSGHFLQLLAPALQYFGVIKGATQFIITSILSSMAQVIIDGGSFRDALKAGFFTGYSAAMAYQVGNIFGHDPTDASERLIEGSLTLNELARASAHGIVQGGIAEASGGDFSSSFFAGFASSSAGSVMGTTPWGRKKFGDPQVYEKATNRTIAAAIIGGTASEISGGKFANGALSGAFIEILNHENSLTPSNGHIGESFEVIGWEQTWDRLTLAEYLELKGVIAAGMAGLLSINILPVSAFTNTGNKAAEQIAKAVTGFIVDGVKISVSSSVDAPDELDAIIALPALLRKEVKMYNFLKKTNNTEIRVNFRYKVYEKNIFGGGAWKWKNGQHHYMTGHRGIPREEDVMIAILEAEINLVLEPHVQQHN